MYIDSVGQRRLLSPQNPTLTALGAKISFEVAVGMNGRIWVKVSEKTEDSEEKVIELIKALQN